MVFSVILMSRSGARRLVRVVGVCGGMSLRAFWTQKMKTQGRVMRLSGSQPRGDLRMRRAVPLQTRAMMVRIAKMMMGVRWKRCWYLASLMRGFLGLKVAGFLALIR